MFGRLADPEGSNNALSQVLFGLALRSVILSLHIMIWADNDITDMVGDVKQTPLGQSSIYQQQRPIPRQSRSLHSEQA